MQPPPRQIQILTLVAQGKTTGSSCRPNISERTVKYHMGDPYCLHLENRAQVIAYAARSENLQSFMI